MAKINEELRTLEIFEIEILELLNKKKVLDQLYFGGGTMLRLCHNLNRYSTDLDFWIKPDSDPDKIFIAMKDILSQEYIMIDNQNKHFTLVFQLKSSRTKRSLKIEIRKEQTDVEWERKIAFSTFTTSQVQVRGLTLSQMMKNKITALVSRKAIRDGFDIEFLLKRGIQLPNVKEPLNSMLEVLNGFKEKDFKVMLGSLLDEEEREYYNERKFTLLQQEIIARLNSI